MRPRRRTSSLGSFYQLPRRPKQTDQYPAWAEGASRALADELSPGEGPIGSDLRIEPRAASPGDGGVSLFLRRPRFIHMEEIMKEPTPGTLLECWLETIRPWQAVFAQNR